ncbi:YifB family Mg chelatase-like AAA ATPase [Candidatus Dojkabacteria bacterium]|uniref:YifB family Mg chelatase-like AAA ATPase n=1 Tax=Candidatus Dojkabacteria bacterium TaxID=2099670 RepID=A0A955L345_9BACT|nr:YifB family Mg chelatase-like AAA ATPase [Candidatus Dojkabacteria bacterium]
MFSNVFTSAVFGLEARLIRVEIDISRGIYNFNIVGLADKAVQESRERVTSAIKNTGLDMPRARITINLSPADFPKTGPHFDLPIAMAILECSGMIDTNAKQLFIGELALDGSLRKVNGALSMAIFAQKAGFEKIFVPYENYFETSLVKGIESIPVKTLMQCLRYLGEEIKVEIPDKEISITSPEYKFDLKDVRGQKHAKRALKICASGGHNLLLSGSPGSGKTLLARSMPSILPEMGFEEALEVTQIYSIAGKLEMKTSLMRERPFRSPHHSSSPASIVGGGKIPTPGEISLSHRGILFLDEFPEFQTNVLESLRQPLEDKVVTISRVNATLTFPANFTLVAAMNPCSCGWFGDKERECVCTARQIINYQRKISGPILDRIDLQVKVPRIKIEEITSTKSNTSEETSFEARQAVIEARKIQTQRYRNENIMTNADLTGRLITKYCKLDYEAEDVLKKAMNVYNLTARSYFRILKVSRTIADLSKSENIESIHLREALSYRFEI